MNNSSDAKDVKKESQAPEVTMLSSVETEGKSSPDSKEIYMTPISYGPS